MSAITFDTLKYANKLKTSGMPAEQAEAQAEALSTVFEANLGEVATKGDLVQMEGRFDNKINDLRLEIADVKSEQKVMKWMLGLLVAGMATLILKAFF